MRQMALALSSSVENQAFVGEPGRRKLLVRERTKESRDVENAHYAIATMKVRTPVIIISLEES